MSTQTTPLRTSSQNYIQAQQTALSSSKSSKSPTAVSIPDGRRNSNGDVMVSPTESWRPSFGRTQSWCQEDLKRELLVEKLAHKEGEGQGFTEEVGGKV